MRLLQDQMCNSAASNLNIRTTTLEWQALEQEVDFSHMMFDLGNNKCRNDFLFLDAVVLLFFFLFNRAHGECDS